MGRAALATPLPHWLWWYLCVGCEPVCIGSRKWEEELLALFGVIWVFALLAVLAREGARVYKRSRESLCPVMLSMVRGYRNISADSPWIRLGWCRGLRPYGVKTSRPVQFFKREDNVKYKQKGRVRRRAVG